MAQKKGKFELASGGTLLLDEIGEMPLVIQPKLLRVLQSGEIERIGGTRPVKLDVRIIAATHRDLKAERFREDLYYRLNVVTIRVPALRERREDILPLARHFLALCRRETVRRVDGISIASEHLLEHYDWPGNVRELQNAIHRAVVLGRTELIRPEDLPAAVIESAAAGSGPALGTYHERLNAAKRDILNSTLKAANGKMKEAAEILQMDLSDLFPSRLRRANGQSPLGAHRSAPTVQSLK